MKLDSFRLPIRTGGAALRTWNWGRSLPDGTLCTQVRQLAAEGVLSVVPWPQAGFQPTPLSGEWIHLIRLALTEAKQAGLRVYLGGELHPGGDLCRTWARVYPHWRRKVLHWQRLLWESQTSFPIWPQVEEVLARVAVGWRMESPDPAQIVVVTPFSEAELQGRLGDDRWTLLQFSATPTDGLDGFQPAVARHLKNQVLGRYRQEFREFLGETMPGLLLPNWSPWAGGLPWSARLPVLVRELTGRDIWQMLPALAADDHAPSATNVREIFRRAVDQAWAERLTRPLEEGCHQMNLELLVADLSQEVGAE